MTTTSTSTSPDTATDVALSLNGYDEVAIAKYFGADYTELQQRPIMLLRSLMFVVERRGGSKDVEAYKTAMQATGTEVNAYFPDDPTAEDQGDEPESDLGKAGAPSL
jgi:hypothetical protein